MVAPRVRRIESSHIADLIRIAELTNLNRWTAAHYLDELKNPLAIMLRLESDEGFTVGFIIGRVVAAVDNDTSVDAEIYNIGVDPDEQRFGCGQVLIEAFFDVCRDKQVRSIWLEVRETNAPAVGLYTKNGFTAISIRRDFYSDPRENGILMRCDLS